MSTNALVTIERNGVGVARAPETGDPCPPSCPAPDSVKHPHKHATVNVRCQGRFGTCRATLAVDVWRYVIGRDRLRQMGTARCPRCYTTASVLGDVRP